MIKHILRIAISIVVLGAAACLLAGSLLSAPASRAVGSPPQDLHAIDLAFSGIKGWFVPAGEQAPCVLLMHGLRADRRSMIERARLLQHAGYAALLFDFQAHGESPGEYITFGYLESANAQAALTLLRSKFKCSAIAAIGQSLGGAAALLGNAPLAVDALVLESVYPTIEEAVADRLQHQLGPIGAMLTPLLTLQLQPRLGVDPRALRPIERITQLHRPVMVISGTADRHTTIDEARRLYEAANAPKEFWAVPGAAHVDLQQFAPELYRQKLLDFLSAYLRRPNSALQQGAYR